MADYARSVPGVNVPSLLRCSARWCLWHLSTVSQNGSQHPTKKPDQSTRDLAKCRTWEDVANTPLSDKSGFGFVFTGGIFSRDDQNRRLRLIGLDIDACRDPELGRCGVPCIQPWALEILDAFGNPCTEVSPSGTGLHVFIAVVEDKIPKNLRAKVTLPPSHAPAKNTNGKKPEIQLFGLGPAQYMTISGELLEDCEREVPVIEEL